MILTHYVTKLFKNLKKLFLLTSFNQARKIYESLQNIGTTIWKLIAFIQIMNVYQNILFETIFSYNTINCRIAGIVKEFNLNMMHL